MVIATLQMSKLKPRDFKVTCQVHPSYGLSGGTGIQTKPSTIIFP